MFRSPTTLRDANQEQRWRYAIAHAKTTAGLHVVAELARRAHSKGRKASEEFLEQASRVDGQFQRLRAADYFREEPVTRRRFAAGYTPVFTFLASSSLTALRQAANACST